MNGIIIYATKYGSTEKAVKLLQSKMPHGMQAVNVARDKAPDLSLFDTVILGGPIFVQKMHKALSSYMKQNCETLKDKRLGLFICAGEQDPSILQKQLASAFPEELYKRAIVREVFGGELYLGKLDPVTKLILRVVKGVKEDCARLSEKSINRFAKSVLAVRNCEDGKNDKDGK